MQKPSPPKLPAIMELSVGRRSESRRNRQYTVIKKLYNLLEGDECSGRNLNRVRKWGVPARGVDMVGLPDKVLFAQRLEEKREVSHTAIWRESILERRNIKGKNPNAAVLKG